MVSQRDLRTGNVDCEVIEIGNVVGWRWRNKQWGVIGVLLLINTVKVGTGRGYDMIARDGRDVGREE